MIAERARLDSNQGPTNYEFAALTAELRARGASVPQERLGSEPARAARRRR
jgi:hypothetical protein